MHSPTNNIVELVVSRESTVTALVTNDPDADTNATLGKAIQDPSGSSESRRGQIINVQSQIDEHCGIDKVTQQIQRSTQSRALKAVSRDLASDEAISEILGLCRVSMNRSRVE